MDQKSTVKLELNSNERSENGIPSCSSDLLDVAINNLQINNTLCAFNMPLHIDLKRVALSVPNVDFDKSRGVLLIQLREPNCTAKVFSSGRVTVQLCKSEADCRKAARRIGRMIQKSMGKLNERICLKDFSVRNISATCRLPFGLKIEDLARKHRHAYYEPELFPGAVWTFSDPKATFRIHTTGTITITGATSESGIHECLRQIRPTLEEFQSKTRHGRTVAIQEKEMKKRVYRHKNDIPVAKRQRGYNQAKDAFMSDDDEDYLSEHMDEQEENF